MATIKAYSDLQQSKKLEEILPIESADMLWEQHGAEPYVTIKPWTTIGKSIGCHCLSCWSLVALLEILDYPQLSKDKLGSGKEGWMVSVYPNDCRYDSCWYDNPVDACVAMIERLHKLKML